jgi:hypothetical protein
MSARTIRLQFCFCVLTAVETLCPAVFLRIFAVYFHKQKRSFCTPERSPFISITEIATDFFSIHLSVTYERVAI